MVISFIFFIKKIIRVVVGVVDMWITLKNKGNTVYPHVDKLCKNKLLLFTLSQKVQVVYFLMF